MTWQLPQRPVNPPIRVDEEVIFWDGTSKKLSKKEIAHLDRGEEVIAPKPPWTAWQQPASAGERAYWKGFYRQRAQLDASR